MQWSVNAWDEWAKHCQSTGASVPPELDRISNNQLNQWLACFVMKVRNKEGDLYKGGTLFREKRMGSNMSKGEPLDIYRDANFNYFRSAFDSILKNLHEKGIGIEKKRAQIITRDIAEKLWSNGCLGGSSPQQLLDTLVFGFRLNFVLHSSREHRSLHPDMLQLVEPNDLVAYIIYTESGSKNRSGGLKDRKVTNKSVKLFANDSDPTRCFVSLYKKYMSLRPTYAPADAFYLKPIMTLKEDNWYYSKAVGHNPLCETVKRLCSQVGAISHFINHSLRCTCTTRLFQSGIDEQTIMSVTGHRSLDAVCVYKEASHEQKCEVSKVLANAPKKPKIDGNERIMSSRKEEHTGQVLTLVVAALYLIISDTSMYSFNNK